MDDGSEVEAHSAAQGLLDFANRVSTGRLDNPASRSSEPARLSLSGRDFSGPVAASPRLAVATVTSTGQGRLITSGDNPLASRQSQDSSACKPAETPRKKGSFRQPAPRRPEGSERVTVILQKAALDSQSAQTEATNVDPPTTTCDVPVPVSAFAPIIGSGDSGKSSTDFSPFAGLTAAKEESGSDAETESDEGGEVPTLPHAPTDSDSRAPLKKQKLTRTVSINTVLQRVGSKEAPLADAVGSAPQTVQEMIPPLASSKAAGVDANVDTLEIVEKLWGKEVAQPPKGPSLPLVVASEPPSLAAVGLRSEGGQVSESGDSRRSRGIKREHSMERALHLPPKRQLAAAAGKAKVVEMGATSGPHSAHAPAAAAQEEAPRSSLWSGKVKHRLKTVEGASVVELFDLTVLIPEKLLEQMPPTLFVSAIAGRANVKLGKHYVTQCRLGGLSERQSQKVLALASMKLVAICELQHCSLTLVPFKDRHQELRMVGFMIADE